MVIYNNRKILILLLGLLFLSGLLAITFNIKRGKSILKTSNTAKSKIVKFSSDKDFFDYIKRNLNENYQYNDIGRAREISAPTASIDTIGNNFSNTNVQVLGIDEADIVKTNGSEIFFSKDRPPYRLMPMDDNPTMDSKPEIKIIKANPLEESKIITSIEDNGEMLLQENVLMVFSKYKDEIKAYDVSNPNNPEKIWNIELKNNSEIVSSRLYKNVLYVVNRSNIKRDNPCLMEPIIINNKAIPFNCTDIYYPDRDIPIDSTYNILSIDPKNGTVINKTSFVGNNTDTVIYMSEKSLYVSYYFPLNQINYFDKFIAENSDLFPREILEKVRKIMSYDISNVSKENEISFILEQLVEDKDKDDQLKFNTEIENRQKDFLNKYLREFEKTEIVKIGIPNLELQATGVVPGKLLNQFSMDEKDGNLRLAVTISQQANSVSDVYVLDNKLNTIGGVRDLGKTERIYSVRFIGDKGYLVTFRQTDPFYVIDLKDPSNPQLKGELKIPGYSGYLHPISKDKILGIGKEDNEVKLSLFDVSDASNPSESAKYILDDYYSEILQNHKAFMINDNDKIFFIPGTKGGYLFSYADDKLDLVKAISEAQIKRAIIINDYLYIISDTKIIILNRKNLEKLKEFEI
jgi:inhibitor of cysteine peptidase